MRSFPGLGNEESLLKKIYPDTDPSRIQEMYMLEDQADAYNAENDKANEIATLEKLVPVYREVNHNVYHFSVVNLYTRMATLALDMGDYEQARNFSQTAITITQTADYKASSSRNTPYAYEVNAKALTNLDQLEEALDILQRSIKLYEESVDSTDEETWMDMVRVKYWECVVYYKLEEDDKCEKAVNEFFKLKPESMSEEDPLVTHLRKLLVSL